MNRRSQPAKIRSLHGLDNALFGRVAGRQIYRSQPDTTPRIIRSITDAPGTIHGEPDSDYLHILDNPRYGLLATATPDDDPETSTLGRFLADWEPGVIPNPNRFHEPADRYTRPAYRWTDPQAYAWYQPSDSMHQERSWYARHGYPRHLAYLAALRSARSQARYLYGYLTAQWSYVGVEVHLFRRDLPSLPPDDFESDWREIDYGSLWGIDTTDPGYLLQVANELARELLADPTLRVNLHAGVA